MNQSLLLSRPESTIIPGLKNRVVMAPMTRSFATPEHLCTSEMTSYYQRRAEAGVGLILTEGIIIHPSADGYNTVPHLHTVDQAESWRPTVDAVHQHGSKIYAQLWHCGRISHEDYTNGYDIVSSTSQPAQGINRQNGKPFGKPRALRIDEMDCIYEMFCNSVELAFSVGFDGVQFHMGHGYLVDQFFDSRINQRNDVYGGSIINRCRFALKLLECVVNKFGSERIMVRISPSRMMMGVIYEWPDLHDMLRTLLSGFDRIGLKQLDISCANADYFQTSGKIVRAVRSLWPHLIIGGASLSVEEAESEIAMRNLDLITWGRAILANPDFVKLISSGKPLQPFEDSMRLTLR